MSLQIIRQGLLDTIQDCGRQGHRHLGIPPGGAMDIFSAVLSNALLGKGATGPVIELHFPAASIMFHRDTIITLAGGDFSPAINNIPVPLHQPIVVPAGSRLTFGDHSSGARCYLSVLQGLSCSSWLGSCAKGPGAGDAMLKAGDIIEFSEEINLGAVVRKGMQVLHWGVVPPPHDLVDIECMYGDEWNRLQQASQQQFLESVYTISPVSDRMGYRLIGEPLRKLSDEEMISSAVSAGTIQLLPDGSLVVLMADHQTTGGYPRIAHVISAHIPYLAQRRPNEFVRFRMTDLEEAEEKLVSMKAYLRQIENECKLKMESFLHANGLQL